MLRASRLMDRMRMPYEIRYSNEAIASLKRIRAFDRTAILDHIE